MASDLSPTQRAKLESDDLGQTTLAIVIAFEVGALVVVLMRFYSRMAVTKGLGRDDWLMLVGMLFSIGMGVCQIMQVQWGSGKHVQFLSPYQLQKQRFYLYWSIALYGVAITFTKLSILLLYRRIFHASKSLMWVVWILGSFVLCFGLSIVFSGLFTCTPANGFWNLSVKAKCVNMFALFEANAAINIGTDFVITVLPLPSIWRLGLPIHQKIGVSFIFAIGWL
ncbi:hypothetical protein EJ05DRAFT_474395 [Pseudovirgaria hyperparasitica]|uniref:Rhodopsin domain-containing protein n=1 Tax=Pseudovirgaria hyperparasitica TaxID=470096 RepID=A0A6A6WD76_9PEZI|nr:uncharacterized protein EJ05DRAFT_474395 [Pseudovirgaria hyperparasitica]KAF2760525.1 hypothetical protein EJ05DRAFT_474395 [Pseudovirgaria hyperparasitica]